jgi:hypothetical protein
MATAIVSPRLAAKCHYRRKPSQTSPHMPRTKNNSKIAGFSSNLAGKSQVNFRSGDVAACMYGAVIAAVELRWPFMFVFMNPEKG